MATAVQVESLWSGITDTSGNALAGGKVYTYSAGTTTSVSLFTASDKSAQATNPIILDSSGKAQVYADGRYKFVIKTSADSTLYTLDNLLYGFDDSSVLWGGLSTGSANTQAVSVPDVLASYSNGQRISFIAGNSNSGATTLNINSLGAVSIVKGASATPLASGDIFAGQLVSCVYYGGSFRLDGDLYPAVTNNIPMGGFKHTNVANGVNATDYMAYGQIRNGAPLYLDTTNSRLGIGISSPTEKLDVLGAIRIGATTAPTFDSITRFWTLSGTGAEYDSFAHVFNVGASVRAEAMRITTAGNVGIGDTNPTSKLSIVGTAKISGQTTIGDGSTAVSCSINGTNTGTSGGAYFSAQNGGSTIIAIGNRSAIIGGAYDNSPTIYGSGTEFKVQNLTSGAGTNAMKWNNSTGGWTYDTSSARYKENIRDSVYGLDAVKALIARQFNYRFQDKREDVGFIAEEVVQVIPELVILNADNQPDAVSYDRLTSVLCKAIQELSDRVEALEARLA